jgi:hypothetical protein
VNDAERQQVLKEKRQALAAARDAYDDAYARVIHAPRYSAALEVAGAKLAAAIAALAAVEAMEMQASSMALVRSLNRISQSQLSRDASQKEVAREN